MRRHPTLSFRSRSGLGRLLAPGLGALTLLSLASAAHAGGTRTENISDFDDFDEGEADGAAIEGSGKITVGFASRSADVEGSSAVFSCLAHKGSMYVGTADEATVKKVTSGKKGPKLEDVAKLDGAVVTAMAPLPGGDLVVATLPGGKLVRVSKKGKVEDFATLDVGRIWALAIHDGRLIVGTGPKGEVYSLSLDGKDAKVVLDVSEKDVLSLLAVDGEMVVGVSPSAKLYRITDDIDGALVQDFKGDEVRALAVTKRGLLAAVNEFKDNDISTLKNLEKSLNRASITGDAPASTSAAPKKPKADAAVYHVDLRGPGSKRDIDRAMEATWEQWLDKSGQYFTGMVALDDDGTVLVSSSRAGRIYRVRGRRDVASVSDLAERQATALCLESGKKGLDRVLATAGDGAAVYELSSAPAAKAKWTSTVYDAGQPASYGAIRALASGGFKIRARSGPTDEPDDRWSDWKEVTMGKSAAEHRGRLDVPRRRYLQLEVALTEADSELRDLEFFFAPENLAPRLASIEFQNPSFDVDDDDEPKPKAKVKWKVDALDDDELVYGVRIRNEGGGDDEWVPLHDETVISDDELDVDLTTLPDGVYEIEVVASDEPSNGSSRARRDELRSDPVVVDRTRPTLSDVAVKGDRVSGTAKDAATYIHDVAFSVDAGEFRAASPKDGLFDGSAEDFEAVLPELNPGKHRLVIRARDAHGNLVTRALIISR